MAAIQSHRTMTTVGRETEESSAKLASGSRIAKAADDAAGLAISERMKSHIRSSKQAGRNANDGISLVQVAEGGLNESTALLTRMRELAVQAASSTMDDSNRAMTEMEYQGLKAELDRIAAGTRFNGRSLLDGSGGEMDFHVGLFEGGMDRITYGAGEFNSSVSSLGVGGVSLLSQQGAQSSLGVLDQAFNKIANQRSQLGSIQNRLLSSSNNLGIYSDNMSAANSRIRDVDVADEASKQARNSVVMQAAVATGAQANVEPQRALKLLS